MRALRTRRAPTLMASQTRSKMEKLGAAASFACAIHCAALPILIGAGAAGTFSFLQHEPVEWGLVLFAAVVGTVGAWRGFRTHGNVAVVLVLMTAVIGLVGVTVQHHGAHAGHNHGPGWMAAVAGVALGVSLMVNNRLCHTCHECHHDESAA